MGTEVDPYYCMDTLGLYDWAPPRLTDISRDDHDAVPIEWVLSYKEISMMTQRDDHSIEWV